jgi:hypothetical protein
MVSNLFCFQENVFSLDLVEELKNSVEALSRDNFFFEQGNGRWGLFKIQPPSHRYENPHDSWFDVSFGNDCKVIEEKMTLPFCEYKNYETIKKTVCVALKWMAEKMSWQEQTRQMSMSIMQHYHLQKGKTTSEIPWHRDNSDQTLVILLDDETKWCGGNFRFKVESLNTQYFQPKRGYGLLFSNAGTQHYVEPLTANTDDVDRTILTIHESQK